MTLQGGRETAGGSFANGLLAMLAGGHPRTPGERADRGAIIIPALIASLVGALLAVGASIAVVKGSNDANIAPVKKPLISYDQR